MEQLTSVTPNSIHPATHIGLVTLRVAQLARSLAYYVDILGFQMKEEAPGTVLLGAQDGTALLRLQEVAGIPPQPRSSSGLYHVAILLPSRTDLGRFLLRIAEAGLEIGQGDHIVSEALYLSDPDENGLEVYRDRPRAGWTWNDGLVKMGVGPVDIRGLIAEARQSGQPWESMPAGTTIGHIHLRVGDVALARDFYHTTLGFDVVQQMHGALFVSAGGYHHHVGLNSWESHGAGQAPQNTAGLQVYEILVPDRAALEPIQERLTARGVPYQELSDGLSVADPWQNQILI
ncbi:MAG TPA: VOC family protein, partial [Ktedonobacteraceae bacterium]